MKRMIFAMVIFTLMFCSLNAFASRGLPAIWEVIEGDIGYGPPPVALLTIPEPFMQDIFPSLQFFMDVTLSDKLTGASYTWAGGWWEAGTIKLAFRCPSDDCGGVTTSGSGLNLVMRLFDGVATDLTYKNGAWSDEGSGALFSAAGIASLSNNTLMLLLAFVGIGLLFLAYRYISRILRWNAMIERRNKDMGPAGWKYGKRGFWN